MLQTQHLNCAFLFCIDMNVIDMYVCDTYVYSYLYMYAPLNTTLDMTRRCLNMEAAENRIQIDSG